MTQNIGKPKKKLADVLQKHNPSVDWQTRLENPVRRMLNALEGFSLKLEAPVEKLIGDSRFNPLYHTGTITIFLLFVILFTGLYLTMFYPFGFTLSYDAVSRIESNLIGRFIRALHRYASDAAVIFALLHGWRTFFQDRFRGPRWLAWTTGVGMAVIVWGIGVTGYWLIWDDRAHILNQTLFDVLKGFSGGVSFISNFITGEAAGSGWVFMLILLLIHLIVSALTGLFLWWHLKHMSRAKWFPPRYWMIITMVLLALSAILFPLGMLPAANSTQLPNKTLIDLFFLFYLPAALRGPTALFWSAVILVIALATAIPWLLPRKAIQPVKVDLNHCDGCTLCERDCPYTAIKMIPRTDGARPKFQAEINTKLCVGCGVCIGSCPDNALTFGDLPLDPLWQNTIQQVTQNKEHPVKVVFTCERHAIHGARSYLSQEPQTSGMIIVPLTCIAMANPNLAAQAIQSGASEVQFVGCPPEDCANREGNLWMQQRLSGDRLPKLKPEFIQNVHVASVAPTEFSNAIKKSTQTPATAYSLHFNKKHLRYFLPLAVLSIIVTAAQLWMDNQPFHPFPADEAVLTINLTHRSGLPIKNVPLQIAPQPDLDHPTRLTLEVDGKAALDKTYPMSGQGTARVALIFEQVRIPAGEHAIKLTLSDQNDASMSQVLFDVKLNLEARQTINLNYKDAHLQGDPLAGEQLFRESTPGSHVSCRICHSLEPGVTIVGPSLAGVSTRAATRVPGMTAEQYIRQSILDPNAYVVPGFPAGQMVQNFKDTLTDDQIDDLVAFLMTLK